MQQLRWRTEPGSPPTLAEVRAFVEEVAVDLDQGSRYLRELRAVLDASRDLEDYLARLADLERVERFRQDGSVASQGERGRSWVDDETWEGMGVLERTLANLLTGETRMMWAGEGAADFARLVTVLGEQDQPRRALSVPCSTGKEPFSLVIAGLRADLAVEVIGVDRQRAYLARARSGVLVPHWRDLELDEVDAYFTQGPDGRTRVVDAVLERCTFALGDVLTGELPAGPFPLVSCRNLLGYFRGEPLAAAVRNVTARVAPGGHVLVDPFVTGSAEMAPVRDLLESGGWSRRFPEASYYQRPA